MTTNNRIVTGFGPLTGAFGGGVAIGPDRASAGVRLYDMATIQIPAAGPTGDMAVTEGTDTFAGTGGPVVPIGYMDATEGADTFFASEGGNMSAVEDPDVFAADEGNTARLTVTEASDAFVGNGFKINSCPQWVNMGPRGSNALESQPLVLTLPAGFTREDDPIGGDYILGSILQAPGRNGHTYSGGLEPFSGWTSNATPTTLTIGNLLIAAVYRRFSTTDPANFNITWPTGWTEIVLFKNLIGTLPNSYQCVGYAYRIVDGTEGSSISITCGPTTAYMYGHVTQYTGNVAGPDAIGAYTQAFGNSGTVHVDGITSTEPFSTAFVSIFGNNKTFSLADDYLPSGSYTELGAGTNYLTADAENLYDTGTASADNVEFSVLSEMWTAFTLEIRGNPVVPVGTLVVTEGRDVFAGTGIVPIIANMAANEPVDVFAATGSVPVLTYMAATEARDFMRALGDPPPPVVNFGTGRRAMAVIN